MKDICNDMVLMPATDLVPVRVRAAGLLAPVSAEHGSGLPFAGGTSPAAAPVAFGARSTDLLGPVTRAAPV